LAVWYDDPIIVTLVLLVVIIAVGTVVLAMRRYGKSPSPEKKQKQPEKKPKTDLDPEYNPMPFKVSKSIQTTMASDAKNELRTLDLERDILGDALRRLYEAHAEGKITEQERDKMAITYKNRMNLIKESISKDESIVALHELEGMQEDLMKLFSERFGELTSKVEELRGRIDVKPIREIPIKMPSQTRCRWSLMRKKRKSKKKARLLQVAKRNPRRNANRQKKNQARRPKRKNV